MISESWLKSCVVCRSREGRPKFSAKTFAMRHQLGDPIAGNYYQAQFDDYVPLLHQQLSGN